MTIADTTALCRDATSKYFVYEQRSGELLGYALLLPKVKVDDFLAKLEPWYEDEENTVVGVNSPVSSVCEGSSEIAVSVVADTPEMQAVFDTNLIQRLTSTPDIVETSEPVLSERSEDNLSKISLILPSDNEEEPGKNSREAVTKRKVEVTDGDGVDVNCPNKRRKEETDEMIKEQGNFGKYDLFVDFLEERNHRGSKYNRKVRCKLCGDGRIHSYGNYRRHLHAIHEPSVFCEICNAEFTQKRCLAVHKKTVQCKPSIKGNTKDINVNIKISQIHSELEPKSVCVSKTKYSNSESTKPFEDNNNKSTFTHPRNLIIDKISKSSQQSKPFQFTSTVMPKNLNAL